MHLCNICNYITENMYSFKRHLKSNKHILKNIDETKKINETKTITENSKDILC